MKVGVIGLGTMGMGAALNLVRKGHQVTGCDVRDAARTELARPVALRSAAPAELARRYRGRGGVRGQRRADRGCAVRRRKAAWRKLGKGRGHPVLRHRRAGGGPRAGHEDRRGRLPDARCAGLRRQGGRACRHDDGDGIRFRRRRSPRRSRCWRRSPPRCGGSAIRPGIGSTVKMVNQLLAGVHIATAAEALALGIRAGADPRTLFEVISSSAGSSWMWQNRVPHILEGDDTPLSAVNIFVKDLGIVLDQARALTFPLPMAAAAHQLFLAAAAHGEGAKDDAFVIRVWQALAGIELPETGGAPRLSGQHRPAAAGAAGRQARRGVPGGEHRALGYRSRHAAPGADRAARCVGHARTCRTGPGTNTACASASGG